MKTKKTKAFSANTNQNVKYVFNIYVNHVLFTRNYREILYIIDN